MSSEARQVMLEIAQIRRDGGTQIREKIDDDVVNEYAEQMEGGAVFPPVIVIYDDQDYWLADGFHRVEARLRSKKETIDCVVYEGTLRDAILIAVKANATHGLRRTNNDKRRAVETILADEVWAEKSNRWIAETCGVSRQLVDLIRKEVAKLATSPKEGVLAARRGQDGKLYRPPYSLEERDQPDDPIEAALRCGDAFDLCIVHLRRVQAEGEQLAKGLGGRFFSGIRLEDFRTHLERAVLAVAATRPSGRCGHCNGAGCEQCEHAGWLCPGKQRLY